MREASWNVHVLLSGSWRGATSVLISNGRYHIVVDTGMPHEAHQLVQALATRGIEPHQVGIVINTHFHVDHVLNNSLFPGSEIFGSQASYDWCRSLYSDLGNNAGWESLVLKYYPETFDYEGVSARMRQLRKLALRLWDAERLGSSNQFRWIETHPLPEGLECLVTSGHVPGHISVRVREGNRSTMIAGDALLNRDQDDRVLTMIPHDREQSRRDRELILGMGGRILPGHGTEFQAPANSE